MSQSAKVFLAVALACAALAPTRTVAAPIVSGTYYEENVVTTACAGSGQCIVNFSQFPASTAGLTITLNRLSCFIEATNGVDTGTLSITDAGENARRPHYFPVSLPVGRTTFSVELNDKVAGGPPRQMQMEFLSNISNPTFIVKCTITGVIGS